MERYSKIDSGGFPREFLLLRGTGCRWKQCTFCDYHEDTGPDPAETNRAVLERVSGVYGTLDIINSGSAAELWFEMHYMYRHLLADFAAIFSPAKVKFRCGIESFDPALRLRWKKGIPASVTVEDVAGYFQGVCLLCCTGVEGDDRERLVRDIAIARENFEYCSINLFCNNGTPLKRDETLARWFITELYPSLKTDPGLEILIGNTDLGVG